MLFHWIFWADESLVLFPSTKKYEKKLNIWFVHLQVIFDQSPTIRKTWTWEFCFVVWILEIWTWNSKRVHLPRSCQKKLCLSPLEEKWRTKRLSCLLSHESRKKSQRSQKAKRSSNQIKRVKENAWMLKLGEGVLAAQWRKSKSLQHLVFPGGLPIQVLTRPDPA